MTNEPNFQKSQIFITLISTTNYSEKSKMDTWSKQTQTKPILSAYVADKIASSFVERPIKIAIRQRRIRHKSVYNRPLRSAFGLGRGDPKGVRSFQCGFTVSIRAIFFSRRQCFSCFSRAIAEFLSEKVSKYSRLRTLYFFEKCGTEPCLCS
jgi:hypothetical protein